jgi:GNAT superfamily N-acetyltransferase
MRDDPAARSMNGRRERTTPAVPVTSDGELTFRSLAALDRHELACVKEIYEEAFPQHQRVPFSELLTADDQQVSEAALREHEPIGLSVGSRLGISRWWFLKYVAVARDSRGSGLGVAIWAHDWDAARKNGMAGIVLEVESPSEAGVSAAERALRERRIRFWMRCGAGRLPVPRCVVPNPNGTGTERLLLMARPVETAVFRPTLSRLVQDLYVVGYGLDSQAQLVLDALHDV